MEEFSIFKNIKKFKKKLKKVWKKIKIRCIIVLGKKIKNIKF